MKMLKMPRRYTIVCPLYYGETVNHELAIFELLDGQIRDKN